MKWNEKLRVSFYRSDVIVAGIIYIYIPVFIFVLSWIKLLIAIPACILMAAALGLFVRQLKKEKKKNNDMIAVNFLILLFVVLCLFWVGFISGWSGYGHQTEDWSKHNAIIHDLSERAWPVIYENGNDVSMLTYYIGQYIVPAFLGKTFALGFQEVLCMNWIWSAIGLILIWMVWLHAVHACNWKKQLFVLVMLVFCGGMMTLQEEIGHAVFPDDILAAADGWRDYFLCYGRYMLQYRTNFISIRWAYGQTLVIWLIAAIFYQRKEDIKNYVVIFIPALFFGSFSFVSLVFLAFAEYAVYLLKVREIKIILRNTISVQNCLMFFSLGLILLLYYIGFALQKKPDGIGLETVSYTGRDWGIYIIYIMGSFLAYALCILKENKKNVLLLASIVIMCILPFVKFGAANDLLMGACIAASFILYIALTEFIFNKNQSFGYAQRKAVLLALLCVGFVKPVIEIYECLTMYDYSVFAPNDWASLEGFANRDRTDIAIDQQYNYYTYNAYETPFMKYIGKHH